MKREQRWIRATCTALAVLATASGAGAQTPDIATPEPPEAPTSESAGESAPPASEGDDGGPTIILAPGEPDPSATQAGEYGDQEYRGENAHRGDSTSA